HRQTQPRSQQLFASAVSPRRLDPARGSTWPSDTESAPIAAHPLRLSAVLREPAPGDRAFEAPPPFPHELAHSWDPISTQQRTPRAPDPWPHRSSRSSPSFGGPKDSPV